MRSRIARRHALFVVLLTLALTVLPGGSGGCFFSDDDTVFVGKSDPIVHDEGRAELRLHDYTLELADDPAAHPVKAVGDIVGISVLAGLAPDEPRLLEDFTARLLDVNRDILALDELEGTLVFEDAASGPAGLAATWRLECGDGETPALGGEDGTIVFEFDVTGELRRIRIDARHRE